MKVSNVFRVMPIHVGGLIARCGLVVATAIAGFGQNAQDGNRNRQNDQSNRPEFRRDARPRDEALARARAQLIREVRKDLGTLPYYDVFDFLEFEVLPDSSIVLSGQTIRPTLKRDAEARLRDIEGISRVVNNIEVLPLSPNDDRIRIDIYRTLFNSDSPLFRYSLGAVPPIRIIVNRGRVTLKGVVMTEGDSNLAYIRARGVPGIFEVKNELQVERREAR